MTSITELGMTAVRTNVSAANSSPANAFNDLVSEVKKSGGQQETTENPDGSFVTTIPPANGPPRVVSYTSPLGLTATEVGYVSPVLVEHFLDSLFQNFAGARGELPHDEAASTTFVSSKQSTSVATAAKLSGYRDDVASKINNLIQQLGSSALQPSSLAGLQNAFDQLMQGSGIGSDSDTHAATIPARGPRALQDFLISALPSIVNGSINLTGIHVDTTA